MRSMPIRPMGVGQTLDRSLQLYRTLFTPLFLLTLIAFGPFYLASSLLLIDVSQLPVVPKFQGFEDFETFWLSRLPEQSLEAGIELWIKIAGVALLALLFAFVALPLHMATGVILTNRALNGEELSLASAFREALRRYWRVLGNGILFWIICIGVYTGVMMGNGFLAIFYGAATAFAAAALPGGAGAAMAGVGFLVIYIGLMYIGILAYYYFVVRFGFFLPPLLFENESVGIGRSWALTRRSFWRLLGIYINFAVLMYVFSVALFMVFAAFGVTLSGMLAVLFVFCAVVPAGIVLYTMAYRIQKVRADGDDLAAMIAAARGEE
ncbi:hypothetical protein [Paenibacillus thermotolerans]|uniref:hypothetical protein n=1 Tax=Paenibacillus thermotolerans TaxID=3027807 RepID=UPI002367864E|nr:MULTISPECIES: hypothetical protein [unclassified Paenibacillus]